MIEEEIILAPSCALKDLPGYNSIWFGFEIFAHLDAYYLVPTDILETPKLGSFIVDPSLCRYSLFQFLAISSLSVPTGFKCFGSSKFWLCITLWRGRAQVKRQGKDQWECAASMSSKSSRSGGDGAGGLHSEVDFTKRSHAPDPLHSQEPDPTCRVGWCCSMRGRICSRRSKYCNDQRQQTVCHQEVFQFSTSLSHCCSRHYSVPGGVFIRKRWFIGPWGGSGILQHKLAAPWFGELQPRGRKLPSTDSLSSDRNSKLSGLDREKHEVVFFLTFTCWFFFQQLRS